MVTAMTALSASSFSVATLNDFTSGSCELVTGSKSTGPTSPFGVWASAFAHSATSAFDRYFAFAALFSMMNAPPPSPFALGGTGIDGIDDGNGIVRHWRRGKREGRYGKGSQAG